MHRPLHVRSCCIIRKSSTFKEMRLASHWIWSFPVLLQAQVRIQDFGQGGPQLLRPKVADVVKRSRASEASILRPGSRARLRALEAFGFLMLKYAFSPILKTLFLLFKTSILIPKVDKNRALDFTSINLRHSDILHLFFNLHELHEQLCFNWMTWGMPSEARLKILWHGWWKIDQLCDW